MNSGPKQTKEEPPEQAFHTTARITKQKQNMRAFINDSTIKKSVPLTHPK